MTLERVYVLRDTKKMVTIVIHAVQAPSNRTLEIANAALAQARSISLMLENFSVINAQMDLR